MWWFCYPMMMILAWISYSIKICKMVISYFCHLHLLMHSSVRKRFASSTGKHLRQGHAQFFINFQSKEFTVINDSVLCDKLWSLFPMLRLSQIWPVVTLQIVLTSFNISSSIWALNCLLTQEISDSPCTSSAPDLSHFSRDPWLFNRQLFRNLGVGTRHTHCY